MIGMEFRNKTIGVCKFKQNSTLLPQTRLQPLRISALVPIALLTHFMPLISFDTP